MKTKTKVAHIPFTKDEIRWIDESLKKDFYPKPFREAVREAVNNHDRLVAENKALREAAQVALRIEGVYATDQETGETFSTLIWKALGNTSEGK